MTSSQAASRRSSAGRSSEPAVAMKMAQCSSQGVPGFPCHCVAGLAAYRFGIGGALGGLWTARRMPFLARLHLATRCPPDADRPAGRAGPRHHQAQQAGPAGHHAQQRPGMTMARTQPQDAYCMTSRERHRDHLTEHAHPMQFRVIDCADGPVRRKPRRRRSLPGRIHIVLIRQQVGFG